MERGEAVEEAAEDDVEEAAEDDVTVDGSAFRCFGESVFSCDE